METWQLGTQAGNAIVDVLFGEFNPSGKLTMTFPRTVGQCPMYYNKFNTGRPNNRGGVFWSHYNDVENTPLFPFGFGLSYADFKYSNLLINEEASGEVSITVTISNLSNVDGEEIAQLYIRDRAASIVRPVKELKGFQKRLIKAGEALQFEFKLSKDDFGFYNDLGDYKVEPGEFDIWVGPDSDAGLHALFELK